MTRSTKVIFQTTQPLVTGRDLYVGKEELPVNVGQLLSRSGMLNYYAGSIPGSPRIEPGDPVILAPTRKSPLPERVLQAVDQRSYFSAKYTGEITAVQGTRAMIDKGTLQEVHERDIYRVYDSSGQYKGMLEVRGLGDLQSSGELYNRFEDRKRQAYRAEVGDRVVFAGQRMQFGLGFEGGTGSSRPSFLGVHENVGGGGLTWNITLANGLGIEMLAGLYQREGFANANASFQEAFPGGPLEVATVYHESRTARFIAPIWVKKNFFYPSLISPFIAGGAAWFQGRHVFDETDAKNPAISTGREVAKKRAVMPTVGFGIEFLPTRLFRPRLDVRHFFGPDLGTRGVHFKTSMTVYSLGIMAAW